jgi:hypothetical protein
MMPQEILIPGTQTKISAPVLIGGLAIMLGIVVFSRKSESSDETGEFDGTGLLASELDRRLQSQWDMMSGALSEYERRFAELEKGIIDKDPTQEPVNPIPAPPDGEIGKDPIFKTPVEPPVVLWNPPTYNPPYSLAPPYMMDPDPEFTSVITKFVEPMKNYTSVKPVPTIIRNGVIYEARGTGWYAVGKAP